jgi:dTDP-4-amino-4,6-dideoxygalactose transaminase
MTMKVPLLDLKAQYQQIRSEVRAVVDDLLESQLFILGPQVAAFEKEAADYCGCAEAVGVSSGTDALLAALMAAGVGSGDLVATTPYTFFATAGSIARVGARPLFVDIEPECFNIDPQRLADALTALSAADRGRLKAIVPVHLYGQCADMDPVLAVAQQYGVVVIEDAAQAIGAEYRGRRAGAMGDMGCFSFFPSKNLGAFGDGGMVTTGSHEIAQRLRSLRVHGSQVRYTHSLIGGNFRLDALQAAVLSVKLKHLDDWTRGRQRNATNYRELFAAAGLDDRVRCPSERESRHIYNQFVISVSTERDALQAHLTAAGIGTAIYYPLPLHQQACFSDLGYRAGDFPVAEKAAATTLALPIYPELTGKQQAYIVDQIGRFFDDHR